jgi:TolA-binding protein
MKKISIFLTLVIVIAFFGCKPSKEKMTTEITKMEKELYSNTSGTIDKQKAEKMITLYSDFSERFPEDTISALYLFKAAEISMNISKNVEAIELYDKVIAKYPKYSKTPDALFLQGFILENNMRNVPKAKEKYLEFMTKFPKNELASQVKFSLDNLGKTPEQIIEEFQNKNNDSLASKQ